MTSSTSVEDIFSELLRNLDDVSDGVSGMKTKLEFVGVDYALIATKVVKRYKVDQNAVKHLQMLIIFGLRRGSGGQKTWPMIYNRCSPSGARILESAVDYFDVKTGRPRMRDTITIPRLLQTFPLLTWNIHWAMVKTRQYVPRTDYSGSLPLCFRYSGSPAIMNQEVWNYYGKDYVQFSLSLGRLWKSNQTLEEAERYATLAFKGNGKNLANRVSMYNVEERINDNRLLETWAQEDEGRKAGEDNKSETVQDNPQLPTEPKPAQAIEDIESVGQGIKCEAGPVNPQLPPEPNPSQVI